MAIVLNERKWTEEMLEAKSLGAKPFETLTRVARYYLDNGMSKRDVRSKLDSFLLQCDQSASLIKWTDLIDNALATASKRKTICISGIPITSEEMKTIDAIDGKQARRLAFTLLCLAKYMDTISGSDYHWVNNKDSDIMRMANINTSIKRQSLMYHNLNAAGLIQFSKKVDNTNVRVCFIAPGDTIMTITDFRNLGYQYMKYHGGPYFVCCNCGITTKYDHPENNNARWKQKYCKSCAADILTQQRVNSVMRQRNRIKNN